MTKRASGSLRSALTGNVNAPLIPASDCRSWQLEPAPPKKLPELPNGEVSGQLYRILVEAGVALTPARNVWDPRAKLAAYRYFDVFTRASDRLRKADWWDEATPRAKGLVSEEFGISVAWYLLKEFLRVVHISDIAPLLECGLLDYTRGKAPKDLSRPDYLCLRSDGKVFIAEVKGRSQPKNGSSLSSNTDKAVRKAEKQVRKVVLADRNYKSHCGRLAIVTGFCIDGRNDGEQTVTRVKAYRKWGRAIPRALTSLVFAGYAKTFRYAGASPLASYLMPPQITSQRFGGWQQIKACNWAGQELVPLGREPLGGQVLIPKHVLAALLLDRETASEEFSLGDRLTVDVPEDAEGSFCMPNGVVFCHPEEVPREWSERLAVWSGFWSKHAPRKGE